jgi:hypothetical protein
VAARGNQHALHLDRHRRRLCASHAVAIQEMVDFLAATKKMDKHQAYQLTSLAGDVAITQLVDGTMGVHVKMPKIDFQVQEFMRSMVQSRSGLCSRVFLLPSNPRVDRRDEKPPTLSTPASRRRTAITRRIMAAW